MSARAPRRIKLSRKKGWHKPEGAIVVSRPSRWGNPFKVGARMPARYGGELIPDRETSVEHYRVAFDAFLHDKPYPAEENPLSEHWTPEELEESMSELRGHDLGCWCPLPERPGDPDHCHAAILLEYANR